MWAEVALGCLVGAGVFVVVGSWGLLWPVDSKLVAIVGHCSVLPGHDPRPRSGTGCRLVVAGGCGFAWPAAAYAAGL